MDIIVGLWHVQDTGVPVDRIEGKISSKTHLKWKCWDQVGVFGMSAKLSLAMGHGTDYADSLLKREQWVCTCWCITDQLPSPYIQRYAYSVLKISMPNAAISHPCFSNASSSFKYFGHAFSMLIYCWIHTEGVHDPCWLVLSVLLPNTIRKGAQCWNDTTCVLDMNCLSCFF